MKYKKGTFVVVPNIDRIDILPAMGQALYVWLCKYADDEGQCFPSRKKLAGHLSCDVRTIDKHICSLQELGFISKTTRQKKGTKQNMSNLYQIHLLRHPSEVNDTTPSEPDVPVTISIKNSTQLTQIVSSANPVVISEEKAPYSFIVELNKLKDSPRHEFKVIALYWVSKGFEFTNKEQFSSALKRELRPAGLLKGYSGDQISRSIEFCKNNYDVWTLETVGKRVSDLINKK